MHEEVAKINFSMHLSQTQQICNNAQLPSSTLYKKMSSYCSC